MGEDNKKETTQPITASDEEVKEAAKKIHEKYQETFKRLAEN